MQILPRWFERAVADEPSSSNIRVDGRTIHYLTWGQEGAEPIVLVHGNGANGRWWSFIAPFLASQGRCVGAIDLSGMGDSDHWQKPSIDGFVRQICAVAEHVGLNRPVTLVGHSFGGLVSTAAAVFNPQLISRLVIIDSPFHIGCRKSHRAPRNFNSVYPSEKAILARFRLMPPQAFEHLCVLEFIARHSITSTSAGWSWKFRVDPWSSPLLDKSLWTSIGQQLRNYNRPTAYLRGELSKLCSHETEDLWRQFTSETAPVIVIPDAHHHLILDQPLAVVAALEALFALPSWSLRQSASSRTAVSTGM